MKIEFWSPDVRVDGNVDLLCFRYVDPVSPLPSRDLWRIVLMGMIDPTIRVDKPGTGPK